MAVGYLNTPTQWFGGTVLSPSYLQNIHDNQNYIWGTNSGTSTPTPTAPTTASASDLLPWAWAIVTESGGTYTFQRGFNISSISKTGTGVVRLTLRTGFPGGGPVEYCAPVSGRGVTARICHSSFASASICEVLLFDAAGVAADGGFSVAMYGR